MYVLYAYFNLCPVPQSLLKFNSITRIFRVLQKVQNKFISAGSTGNYTLSLLRKKFKTTIMIFIRGFHKE